MRQNNRQSRRPKQYSSKLIPVSSTLFELHSRGKSLEFMRTHLERNFHIHVDRSTISRHLKRLQEVTLPAKSTGDHLLNRPLSELR